MNKRSSALARVIAVTTLVVAFVVAVAVISGTLGGSDSNDSGAHKHGQSTHKSGGSKSDVPATYVVKSGDTLIAISHRLGVPVAQIQELNPEVDPQILIAGEKLKLRETP